MLLGVTLCAASRLQRNNNGSKNNLSRNSSTVGAPLLLHKLCWLWLVGSFDRSIADGNNCLTRQQTLLSILLLLVGRCRHRQLSGRGTEDGGVALGVVAVVLFSVAVAAVGFSGVHCVPDRTRPDTGVLSCGPKSTRMEERVRWWRETFEPTFCGSN